MAYTKTELKTEVIAELFSLGSGQSPSTEDSAWVETRINSTFATLAKLNIIYLADPDDIPDEAFNGLVAYMTEVCGPKFGKPRDRLAMRAAVSELRTIQRIGGGTGSKLKTDPMMRSASRILRPERF